MNFFRALHERTSIKTKGIVYMMLMIALIYLSVSLVVLSTSRKNLDLQIRDFHNSIAEKLAVTASDAMISRDFGPLLEQVRQLKQTSQVRSVEVIDSREIIVLSDDLGQIGKRDTEMFRRLKTPDQAGQDSGRDSSLALLPISVGGDVLGAIQIDFEKDARSAKEFRKTKIELIYLSFLIFAAGIGGSFVVSSILTKPMTRIVKEVQTFEKEITFGASSLYDPLARDESVQLGQAFRQMIGNLKKYLKEFRKISEETEKLTCMAAVGQMSAQIAHEMRNSLYAIRGAASELGKAESRPELIDYIDIIKDESLEMMIMADEYLRFSRVPLPSPVPCLLNEVVDRVAELLETDLEEAGVKVENRTTCPLPQVMCDPALFKQVFMNLFINAIQAMKGGGKITVEYELGGGQLKVHVMDTGPGVPEKIAKNIFQPFFTTKTEGSGLGLAATYKIILTHHGEITLIRSEKGAHFMIQLPVPGDADAVLRT
ncbi:MAG: ATP-binding protein [Nitrospiraceae bacterium]|nr:ATP-binding protein [Nitrospiraceae bacterium]